MDADRGLLEGFDGAVRVLIVGAGYVGAGLAARLATRYDVTLASSRPLLAWPSPPQVTVASYRGSSMGDLLFGPASDLLHLIDMTDVVVHATGPSGRAATTAQLHAAVDAHVGLLRTLCNHSHARLIYLSSMAVYHHDTAPSEPPYREDSVRMPQGLYAALKMAAEELLQGLPRTTVLRLAHVYGPSPAVADPNGLVTRAVAAAANGDPLSVSRRSWDFVHLTDVAHAVARVCEGKAQSAAYNIGDGPVYLPALVDMLNGLARRRGLPGAQVLEVDEHRSGPDCYLDCARAELELGWTPTVFPDVGLNELLAVKGAPA